MLSNYQSMSEGVSMSDEREKGTAVEAVIDPALFDKVRTGSIKFTDLVKAVAPPPERPKGTDFLPAAELTSKQMEALKALPEVFGSVVPDRRRAITPDETLALLTEREILDVVAKMAKDRIETIRTTALNHGDIETEKEKSPEELVAMPLDKDGHYPVSRKIKAAPGEHDKCFSLEPSAGGGTCTADRLKALADDPNYEGFTHEDYLSFTEQVRVFDDNKAMLVLKKRPELIAAIRDATVGGLPSITVRADRKA